MLVRFNRNTDKNANEDVREMIFFIAEDKIQLTFHTDNANIAASVRDFVKPPNWDEKGATIRWGQDMHHTFQVSSVSQ